VNGAYNGKFIDFTSGNANGLRGQILTYTSAGGTATFTLSAPLSVTPLPIVPPGTIPVVPAAGSTFQIESSDTGRSQLDNVTRDNTPIIFLRLDDAIFLHDLPGNPAAGGVPPMGPIVIPFNPSTDPLNTAPGYRIAIFDEGSTPPQLGTAPQTLVGFAAPVPGQEGVYSFQFPSAPGPFLPLSDGSHFITARVQLIDPATPTQNGFGDRSLPLEIVVDTHTPPVFFGLPFLSNDGLDAASDTGVIGQPATFTDRITSNTQPTFFGTAEANSIVKLYADLNNNGIVDPTDFLIGQTVATPLDGTNQYPGGRWVVTSDVDLNDPVYFPHDGVRKLLVTAEDPSGNLSAPGLLSIFLDTAGPQIASPANGIPAIQINSTSSTFDLFGLKLNHNEDGPTPLVNSLIINVQDLPVEDAAFLRNAIQTSNPVPGLPFTLPNPGIFVVQGDHNGVIPITQVIVTNNPNNPPTFLPIAGQKALATVQLVFAQPLPDDCFTLTIQSTGLVDPAGNQLDGESNAIEPVGTPIFPSGDGQPGGNFVARFTVDSRPELGTYAAGAVFVDINGNMVWDPQGQDNDFTNRDLTFSLGLASGVSGVSGMGIHDDVFAGKFAGNGVSDGFDKLAAYGFDPVAGSFRWLIDTNNNGVIDTSGDFHTIQPLVANFNVNALPVAGNFDGVASNGDELGLFNGTQWAFDTNHNHIIDSGDTIVSTSLRGAPIVGDFNGDGVVDLATFKDDAFSFNFGTGAPGTQPSWSGSVNATINFGLPGNVELPVAADMNQDGITDIGLFLPGKTGVLPQSSANWEFLLSKITEGQTGFNALNHPYTPTPLGNDIFAQFGDASALPVVGNFDPPTATPQLPTPITLAPILGTAAVNASVGSGGQWYAIEPLRSGTVSVSSTATTIGTHLDINLYDANYHSIGGSDVGVGVTAGQTYLVRLTGNDPAVSLKISNTVADSDRCDTNRDGHISASDLLKVINDLLSEGRHATPLVLGDPKLYLDTNLDGQISPQDALVVINYLLSHSPSTGGSNLAGPSAAPSAATSASPSVVPDASAAVTVGLVLAADSSTPSTSEQSGMAVAQAPADAVYSQIGSTGAPASEVVLEQSTSLLTATKPASSSGESSQMAVDASLTDPNWDPLS
ncbi:MAG: hypothetical protein HY288_06865, partial [Planctomycetia bacterium]|nr:hypothetical protein [Planctomycetia bacterium]